MRASVLRIALLAALLAGCADNSGIPPPAAGQELTLGESLVARGQEHELDTVRVPPPGDFIEHEAAGFAKVLCSAVFLTGLDFEDAWTQIGGFTSRHRYRDRLPGRVLDRENGRVHITTDTGVTRTAVLHGDQGCVALPKGEDAPFYETVPVVSLLDENAPWPMGDALPDEPLPDDVDAEKLAAAVEAAFEPEAMTLAFVVLHRGRLIAERYREGIDKDTPLESWSMNKSLSASLMGVLIEQGDYTLDQLAPVDSWHEAPDDVRGTIRIQDILRMSRAGRSTAASSGSTTRRAVAASATRHCRTARSACRARAARARSSCRRTRWWSSGSGCMRGRSAGMLMLRCRARWRCWWRRLR